MLLRQGWGLLSRCRSRAGFVIPLLEQGWVCDPAAVGLALIAIVWLIQGWLGCYPAVGAGLGLLSRCCTCRFGFHCDCVVETGLGLLSRCCRFGFDCDCVVETGLGLLSRCKGRTWSVIPLPKQGWVCYPTAGSSILLVSERLRLGGVRFPGAATSKRISPSYGPVLLKCLSVSRKRCRLRRDRLT